MNLFEIFKKKDVFIKIFFVIFSIFISVFLIEIYLNYINYPYQNCKLVDQPSEAYFGKFNEKTGWSYKESTSFYDGNNKYQYYFDKNGTRVEKSDYKINHTKPIILFIGGSVTFGEKLNYKDTFPAQINNLLENKFEIVNLGVQGFGSTQSMILLKTLIEEIKPSYIVYTFIPDHINRNINYDRRLHTKCLEFSGTKPVFGLNKDHLHQIKKPQIYSVVDKYKFLLLLKMSQQNFQEKGLTKNGDDLKITKKIINKISDISDEYNAKDFYIFYDTVYDLSPDSWNRYLLEYLFEKNNEDRVLNFTNWAEDSEQIGLKYYSDQEDNYHPNKNLSLEIAKKFATKFKNDLNY